jgi:hypothetical protein
LPQPLRCRANAAAAAMLTPLPATTVLTLLLR